MQNSGRQPLVIAHRGARHKFPENTLAAFEAAFADHADGVELDVMLTSDKVAVVTHNDDLEILFKRKGYVHATPFREISSLGIPTLEQALNVTASKGMFTIVEIKAQPHLKRMSVKLVGRIITNMKLESSVLVSSFHPAIIMMMRMRYPNIRRALIVTSGRFSFLSSPFFAKVLSLHSLHAELNMISSDLVERYHERGAKVFGWTAKEKKDVKHLIENDVDGIITDNVPETFGHLKNAIR